MHQHHWDSWLHFPLAAVWVSVPAWINYIDAGGRFVTLVIGIIVGGLQIAYLVRKHMRLK